MAERDVKGIIGGTTLVALGALVLWRSFDYGLGSATRMGPGYFPMLLGLLSLGVGSAIALPALRRPGERPIVRWRPLLAVGLGMLGFILILPRLGLLPAVAAAAVVSAFGDADVRPKSLPILAGAICLGAWAIFVWGLGVRVPLLRWH